MTMITLIRLGSFEVNWWHRRFAAYGYHWSRVSTLRVFNVGQLQVTWGKASIIRRT